MDKVRRALDALHAGEEITITIESADAHEADPVIALLDERGFDY